MKGHSRCLSCGHDLAARDLIPVASWIAGKGRCRYCKEPIGSTCLVSEILMGVVFTAIVLAYGFSVETVELLLFASVLMFISVCDIESYTIPNACIAISVGIRCAYMAYAVAVGDMDMGELGYYVFSSLGAGAILLIVVLAMDKILARPSMGGGDLKLFAVASLFFGAWQMILLVPVSCIIGLFVSAMAFRRRRSHKSADMNETIKKEKGSKAIPFGPSIAIACILTMLVGAGFENWYSGMLL